MKIKLLFLFFLCLTACQQPETEISGTVQGTTYHIKAVLSDSDITPEELRKEIEETFSDIDIKLSNYREDSEISNLNRQKTKEWLPISQEIADLIVIAKQVHTLSNGCYDLTIKPLFDLWGFSRHEMKVPEQSAIDKLLPHIGLDKIVLDEENLRIKKLDPEVGIDLSSIAQGYTVGAISELLESYGVQNYLAEIGGEMKVKGRKPNGDEWKVAVEKPTPFSREVQKIFSIHQQYGIAIMTSGTYRNFFEQQGQVYSHILNPKTGKPIEHKLLSVTVLHDDPTWADAWSTALICLGEEEGLKVADANHLRAFFVYGENQQLHELMSREMEKEPSH